MEVYGERYNHNRDALGSWETTSEEECRQRIEAAAQGEATVTVADIRWMAQRFPAIQLSAEASAWIVATLAEHARREQQAERDVRPAWLPAGHTIQDDEDGYFIVDAAGKYVRMLEAHEEAEVQKLRGF